jgi:hypothetical protein
MPQNQCDDRIENRADIVDAWHRLQGFSLKTLNLSVHPVSSARSEIKAYRIRKEDNRHS